MRTFNLCLVLFVPLIFFQCSKDKAAPIVPISPDICDSINPVSFSLNIIPLLSDNNCFHCHAPSPSGLGIPPNFYDHPSVVTHQNIMLRTIQHDPSVRAMPYDTVTFSSTAKISQSLIDEFYCWIQSGSPDN